MKKLKEMEKAYYVYQYLDGTEDKYIIDPEEEELDLYCSKSPPPKKFINIYFTGNLSILTNLKKVYINFLTLIKFPNVYDLPALERLSICLGNIKYIPDIKKKLIGLKIHSLIDEIIYSENDKSYLENKNTLENICSWNIFTNEKLKRLSLESCKLKKIPVLSTPNLQTLSLEDNKISDIGVELKHLENLIFLNLSENNIEVIDCNNLPQSLRKIYIFWSNNESIRVKNIDNLINLETIYVNDYNFYTNNPDIPEDKISSDRIQDDNEEEWDMSRDFSVFNTDPGNF